ncbi:MAG: murein hydrolase activator EnvC family protein [Bacillota bacterium]|jgi:murein DD-endopeptidase MepM/ murein hydrolase activator NlpD
MSVRDLFDNNGGSDYGWNNNGRKPNAPFGHFIGQLVIAGLIFSCVLFCYDKEGTAGDAVRFVVAMATVDNGEMLAVDGNAFSKIGGNDSEESSSKEALDTSAAYQGVTDDKGVLSMILPMSGVMEKSFGDVISGGGTSDGIDIRSESAQKIKATAPGTVSDVITSGSNCKILIKHNDTLESHYVGVETVTVKEGDEVMQGDKIGSMPEGSILHFSVYKDGKCVDPLTFLESPSAN